MADLGRFRSTWNLDGEPPSEAEAAAEIQSIQVNYQRLRCGSLVHLCLAIVEKDSDDFIGWCGLDHHDPEWPRPVVFYLLKRAHWGRGYATEAARALLGVAFRVLRLDHVDAGCESGNVASKRVLEKIGMRYLGMDSAGGHAFSLRKSDYADVLT